MQNNNMEYHEAEEEVVREEYEIKKEEEKGDGKSIGCLVGILALFGGVTPVLFMLVFLLFAGMLITEEEDGTQRMGLSNAFCSVTGEISAGQLNDKLTGMGVFEGKGQAFMDAANIHGIDPVLMAAIALHETGKGTSNAVVNYNNPGGLMDPATGSKKLYRFATLEDGLDAMGRTLHNRIIKDGLNTIEKLGNVYAPIGAANDPNGLNKHWIPNVTEIVNHLGGLTMNCEYMDLGGELLIPTVGQYHVNSPFGYRKHPIYGDMRLHAGLDLKCATGDPIIASESGKVVYQENRRGAWSTGWGNYVRIDHGGFQTLYAHLNSTTVQNNQVVSAGELIGYCGNTGASKGAHLHLEVFVNGKQVDPLPYLEGN